MQGLPKTLLALAFTNLVAALLSVFFLFGGLHLFGTSENGFSNFLRYAAQQMLWILPVVSFFGSIRLYDHDKKAAAYCIALLGTALTITDIVLLII